MAIYSHNYITREVSGVIPAYRLVKEANGKIQLSDAESVPFGAVTEAGDESGNDNAPIRLRVSASQGVVTVEADAAADFDKKASGTAVFAAKDGKVSNTGSVQVGILDAPAGVSSPSETRGVKTVRINLFHPSAKGEA